MIEPCYLFILHVVRELGFSLKFTVYGQHWVAVRLSPSQLPPVLPGHLLTVAWGSRCVRTWQCPYTPLELHQLKPHDFAYGDRVVLPDGRSEMVFKVGYKYGHVDADTGAFCRGLLAELRPAVEADLIQPQQQQLRLLLSPDS